MRATRDHRFVYWLVGDWSGAGVLSWIAAGLRERPRSDDAGPARLNSAPEASLVYDRHNNLIFSFASEDRTNVPLDRVSSAMVSAVLAAEDRYFYKHAGHGPHRPGSGGLGRFEGTGGQAGRQHHHTAARPADCALTGSQLSAARSRRRCSRCASSADSTRSRSSRRTSTASISATATTAWRRRLARIFREAGVGAEQPPKARCWRASFPARRSVRRASPRRSPNRAGIWC